MRLLFELATNFFLLIFDIILDMIKIGVFCSIIAYFASFVLGINPGNFDEYVISCIKYLINNIWMLGLLFFSVI